MSLKNKKSPQDINYPYDNLTPPIESIESIERSIKKGFRKSLNFTSGGSNHVQKHVKSHDAADSSEESCDIIVDDDDPVRSDCSECGKDLGDEYYTIHDLFCPTAHLCPDCYRKRYGPYKCYNCEKEFSAKEIDWDNSDKDEDSYICRDCSYNQQFGWD